MQVSWLRMKDRKTTQVELLDSTQNNDSSFTKTVMTIRLI